MRFATALVPMVAAVAAVAFFSVAARADTTSTFSNFAGDVSLNSAASFNDSGLGSTGPLAFDPNNPDTLFVVNRAAPPTPVVTNPVTPPGTGGIYPFSVSAQKRITNSSGNIFITANSTTSSATTMAWSSSTDPYADLVGNDGSLYVAFDVSAGLYKISNPLSDSPTYTRMFPGYGGAGDDDPVNIFRMPASFGLANYTSNDLLILDDGLNADGVNALSAVHADGSDGNLPTLVWKRPGTPASGTIHGAVNPVSGCVYFINTTPEHSTIDGSDHVIINRVKGDGVLQTIGLNLPAGVTLDHSDDPIAINPVDGSIWLADSIFTDNGDGTSTDSQARTMLRIDTTHLTSTSDPNDFLADATAEFSASNFNIGVNSLTFSNDGTILYAGTPNGTDKLWAFSVVPQTAPTRIPGDTNGDGVVDLTDLNNVLNNFGVLGSGNPGDDNNDGVVDLSDLNDVLNNFGTHSPAASGLSIVPEPASLSLLAIGAAGLLTRRRRSL